MKVVLFCGGLGTRLREHSDTIPKPLVPVGQSPIILHLMRYYAHYGHKDFVLCLGYKGELIKDFFLNYNPHLDEDFELDHGTRRSRGVAPSHAEWRITFVNTGLHSNIGQRLRRVRHLLDGEETFLANYSDQLSDFPLPKILELHREKNATASFLSVRPSQAFHTVDQDEAGRVRRFGDVRTAQTWINGGYMVLNQSIFDVLEDGEELVEEPFHRLMAQDRLYSMRYEGFWAAMDTFKDKINLDRMDGREERPWQVWS